jgi:hypothetical protein
MTLRSTIPIRVALTMSLTQKIKVSLKSNYGIKDCNRFPGDDRPSPSTH